MYWKYSISLAVTCILGIFMAGCQPLAQSTIPASTLPVTLSLAPTSIQGITSPTTRATPSPEPSPSPVSTVQDTSFTFLLQGIEYTDVQAVANLCAQYSRMADADWNPVMGIRFGGQIVYSDRSRLLQKQPLENGSRIERCWEVSFSGTPRNGEPDEVWLDDLEVLSSEESAPQPTLANCQLVRDKINLGDHIGYRCLEDPAQPNGFSIEITHLPDKYLTQKRAEWFVRARLEGATLLRGPWVFGVSP